MGEDTRFQGFEGQNEDCGSSQYGGAQNWLYLVASVSSKESYYHWSLRNFDARWNFIRKSFLQVHFTQTE